MDSNVIQRKKLKSKKEYIMMIDVIFWMCVTDGLHAAQMCTNWLPQSFIDGFSYGNIMCKFIGVWAMWASIQSPLLHMLLAYHVFYLLIGNSLESLNKQKKYHFIFVAIV